MKSKKKVLVKISQKKRLLRKKTSRELNMFDSDRFLHGKRQKQ